MKKQSPNFWTSWEHINVCFKCENKLSRSEEYHSGGICPHCGHDSHSTICNTRKVIFKKGPIYEETLAGTVKYILDIGVQYVFRPKNKFSQKWLEDRGCAILEVDK